MGEFSSPPTRTSPDPQKGLVAGGWRELESLRQCYQQADEATMLEVVLSGGRLRESKE